MMRNWAGVHSKVCIAALIACGALVLYFNVWLFRLFDGMIYASHFPTGDRLSEQLVIVKVDDTSLQKIGAWPWDRSIFARLVQRIAIAEPTVIALDFAFESQRSKQGDSEFAEIVGREKKRIVLASLRGDTSTVRLYPDLAAQHPMVGYVNTGTSDDLESTVALPCARDGTTPSLPELVARVYLNRTQGSNSGTSGIRIPESAHPRYRQFGECALPINFAGGLNSIKSIGASDLLALPEHVMPFRPGSIVIVGPYAEAMGDVHFSPISGGRNTPGPLILAFAVNTAISTTPVHALGYWTLCGLVACVSIVAVWCFAGRERLGWSVTSFVLIGLTIFVTHDLAFRWGRYYFPPTPFLLAISFAFVPRALEILGIEIESGS